MLRCLKREGEGEGVSTYRDLDRCRVTTAFRRDREKERVGKEVIQLMARQCTNPVLRCVVSQRPTRSRCRHKEEMNNSPKKNSYLQMTFSHLIVDAFVD